MQKSIWGNKMSKTNNHLHLRIGQLEKKIKSLVEALKFYADRSRWNDGYPGGCKDGDGLDFGNKARKVLKDTK